MVSNTYFLSCPTPSGCRFLFDVRNSFQSTTSLQEVYCKSTSFIHIGSGNIRPLFNVLYLTPVCVYHHIPSVFLPLTDHVIFDSGFNDGVHIKNLSNSPSVWNVHSSIFEPYWISSRPCFLLALFACEALQISVASGWGSLLSHCFGFVVGVLTLQSWGV